MHFSHLKKKKVPYMGINVTGFSKLRKSCVAFFCEKKKNPSSLALHFQLYTLKNHVGHI